MVYLDLVECVCNYVLCSLLYISDSGHAVALLYDRIHTFRKDDALASLKSDALENLRQNKFVEYLLLLVRRCTPVDLLLQIST